MVLIVSPSRTAACFTGYPYPVRHSPTLPYRRGNVELPYRFLGPLFSGFVASFHDDLLSPVLCFSFLLSGISADGAWHAPGTGIEEYGNVPILLSTNIMTPAGLIFFLFFTSKAITTKLILGV